ncbi:hypothetical protein PFLUV_G00008950 [Perca fluviatilis]|uniref:Uncharacterized protein n=1 Tax=Perca fluviatilis TaxID=8168 RepID=A0A6A5FP04_PERFL|nr:hypothetical protein PFLUV_G00008950 [Perca fluviatilis]
MRLLLTIILILLFLWFHRAQMSNDTLHGNPCEAVSMSEAAVSLLLSPLSLYSWLASMLLRLVLSVPALVLSSLHLSLLLLLAWPWCVATVCVSLLLTCVHVALYLLHLALVVGVVAILTLTQHKMADSDTTKEKVLDQQKKPERFPTQTRLGMFGCRVVQHG